MSFTLTLHDRHIHRVRFVTSPLLELATSVMLLKKAASGHPLPPVYTPWLDDTRRALHGLPLPLLNALVLTHPCHHIADFLSSPPPTSTDDIEAEFMRLLHTPAAQVRADLHIILALDATGQQHAVLARYADAPLALLPPLVAELRAYWARALAPRAATLRALAARDVLAHARTLALHGPQRALSALSPDLHVHAVADGLVLQRVDLGRHPYGEAQHYNADEHGVQLAPVLFGGGRSWHQRAQDGVPVVMVPARGAGLLRPPSPLPEPEAALRLALGDARARVLVALDQPQTTTSLARRLHMTAGALSQQLGKLSEAGLVAGTRDGVRVYYRLTPRGEGLLALFTQENADAHVQALALSAGLHVHVLEDGLAG